MFNPATAILLGIIMGILIATYIIKKNIDTHIF